MKKKEEELSLEINTEVDKGEYSNLVLVNHSPSEFVLDFAKMMPGYEKAKVVSRVVVSPLHTKRFLKALANNIENFEKEFGAIEEPTQKKFDKIPGITPQGEA